MSTSALPLHPSLRHPLTGAPIRALAERPGGGFLWPMMGGAEGDDPPAGDPPAGDPPKADPPTPTPPKPGVPDGYATDNQGNSLGFPKETSVAEMKLEEQVAYHRHQSRKHEQRASEWKDAAGGKTPAEVKAERDELTRLRTAGMTDAEKQLDAAKQAGREEARTELAPKMARLAFNTALAHVPDEERSTLIENLDLSKVITESGDIDTGKVSQIVSSLGYAPGKGTPPPRTPNYGGGPRPTPTSSGVSAGAEMFAAKKKPAPTPSA